MYLPDKNQIIEKLNLKPHPEGGFYAETYRSSLELTNLKNFGGARNCATNIYYLLEHGDRSHFHRIKSDETWHFYCGAPLRIVMLDESKGFSQITLGTNLTQDETFQFVVPAGVWFGAEVVANGEYTLVGCGVAPGFHFDDFELASKQNLLALFPAYEELIDVFCLR